MEWSVLIETNLLQLACRINSTIFPYETNPSVEAVLVVHSSGRIFISHTIGPNDLLPSPVPHFKTLQVYVIYLPKFPSFSSYFVINVDRNSSVGTMTSYGLYGPGIESRWGGWGPRFSAPVQTDHGAHPASYEVGTGLYPEVKRPGRGFNYPPQSRSGVKERIELYLYSPSGA